MEYIIHIGAAKTGTTTIQQRLENDASLAKQGAAYLGLMLENTPALYDWQNKKKINAFHHLARDAFDEQVSAVLLAAGSHFSKNGISKLIWSNEMLFKYSDKLVTVIGRLLENGHTVKVVGYIRNHMSWARSAFEQFSLFSKTYKGQTLSFLDYFTSRPVSFSSQIRSLAEKYPELLFIRSLDNTPDLLEDFNSIAGLGATDKGHQKNRNTARPFEELLFRVCYNNSSEAAVAAREFNEHFSDCVDFRQTPQQYLQALLPKMDSIAELTSAFDEDRKALTSLISELDLPETPQDPEGSQPVSFNNDVLIFNLLKIVMKQQRQIDALARKTN